MHPAQPRSKVSDIGESVGSCAVTAMSMGQAAVRILPPLSPVKAAPNCEEARTC